MAQRTDDSAGAIGDFCASIGGEFVAVLAGGTGSGARLADVYLTLRIDEPFSAFDARSAKAAMDAAALTQYRENAAVVLAGGARRAACGVLLRAGRARRDGGKAR